MTRPRDELDAALRKLALKIAKDALDGTMDDSHGDRVETLKVAGNYAATAKRAKVAANDADDDDTMKSVKERISAAEQQPGGHA